MSLDFSKVKCEAILKLKQKQLEDGTDADGSKLSSSEGRLRSRSPKRRDDVSVVSHDCSYWQWFLEVS